MKLAIGLASIFAFEAVITAAFGLAVACVGMGGLSLGYIYCLLTE